MARELKARRQVIIIKAELHKNILDLWNKLTWFIPAGPRTGNRKEGQVVDVMCFVNKKLGHQRARARCMTDSSFY